MGVCVGGMGRLCGQCPEGGSRGDGIAGAQGSTLGSFGGCVCVGVCLSVGRGCYVGSGQRGAVGRFEITQQHCAGAPISKECFSIMT